MLVLKQLTMLFLCHKSRTTGQIDSYKVSNYKLKPDICNQGAPNICNFHIPKSAKVVKIAFLQS